MNYLFRYELFEGVHLCRFFVMSQQFQRRQKKLTFFSLLKIQSERGMIALCKYIGKINTRGKRKFVKAKDNIDTDKKKKKRGL